MEENKLPWQTPKIQMIVALLGGKVSSVTTVVNTRLEVSNETK